MRPARAGRRAERRPLRVVLVAGELRPELDGVADAVVTLAESLRQAGATVRIVHVGLDADVPGARSIGDAWGPRALLSAAVLMRDADVVHVQFAPSAYRFRAWIGLLPLLVRAPVVTTVHEYGWWTALPRVPTRVWRALERMRLLDRETLALVPRSDAVVVTNAAHEQVLRRRFAAARIVRIPIGANVQARRYRRSAWGAPEARERLGLPVDAQVVAFFGFVHPVKGLRYLVDAVAALRGEGRDLHLLVLGGFESLALPAGEAEAFEAELRAHVDAAGMSRHTTITGYLPPTEIGVRLVWSDLAALPFTAGVTAKSGSLLTLMSYRLPTLVTAPPEAEPELVDGENCVVVAPVRDADAIAAGLRRLLDDRELAARVRDGGLELARSRGWDRIAAAHLELYRSVVHPPAAVERRPVSDLR